MSILLIVKGLGLQPNTGYDTGIWTELGIGCGYPGDREGDGFGHGWDQSGWHAIDWSYIDSQSVHLTLSEEE